MKPCFFCGKRVATKLCDAPFARVRHIAQWDKPAEETIICDRFMCDKCAIDMGNGIDYCPVCFKRIKFA